MRKHILCILLALVVLTGCFVTFAAAEEMVYSGTCGENATWSYDATTKTLTISGTGPMENTNLGTWNDAGFKHDITRVVIESGITAVGQNAFNYFSGMTSVEIPATVTRIEENAFYLCWRLTDIKFPASVSHIGKNAFSSCSSLTSIELPRNLTECGPGAFSSCSRLTSVKLPSSLKQIPYSMFEGCESLSKITIPAGVEEIDAWVWQSCSVLNSITFEGNAPTFHESAFLGITAVVSYPGNNTTWTADKLQNYDGNITWLANNAGSLTGTFGNSNPMTWKLEGSTLYIIGDGYMDGWSSKEVPNPPWYPYRGLVKKVVLDGNIENIYTGAFRGFTELTEVVWSPTVELIYNGAFSGCTRLSTIEIPNAVKRICDGAFGDCTALHTVKLPSGLEEISYRAFAGCTSLKSLTLPTKVKELGSGVFDGGGLETIYITGNMPAFSRVSYYPGSFVGLENVTIYYAANNKTWTAEKIQEEESRYSDGSVKFVATEELNSYTVFQQFVDDSKQNSGSSLSGSGSSNGNGGTNSGGSVAAGKDPAAPENTDSTTDSIDATQQAQTVEGTQSTTEVTVETEQTPQGNEKSRARGTWSVIVVVVGVVVVADAVIGVIYLKKRKKTNEQK